ncbi:MAG: hypothetical protein ACRCUQ_03175 [Alphaproteobacteria bacterium]
MKLHSSYLIGFVALISLASQAFPVNPKSFDAKAMGTSSDRSSTPKNSLLVEALDLPQKRSPKLILPLSSQEVVLHGLISASSTQSPREPLSYSPSISPSICSGGTVFIYENLPLEASKVDKIPSVSLAQQEPLSPEEVSDILAHSDLSYTDTKSEN